MSVTKFLRDRELTGKANCDEFITSHREAETEIFSEAKRWMETQLFFELLEGDVLVPMMYLYEVFYPHWDFMYRKLCIALGHTNFLELFPEVICSESERERMEAMWETTILLEPYCRNIVRNST